MIMERRTLLKSLSATAFVAPFGHRSLAFAQDLSVISIAARDAWLFGLPLIENARARAELLDAGTPPNRILHARRLTTPATQFVTTPNNDTLYSRAWINLTDGPVKVTLPRSGSRYCSVAFMDMYTNNFAIVGTRTTGGDGGTFMVVGPAQATTDPLAIRAPSNWVWMLVRMLIDGDADLTEANALQDAITVVGPAARKPPRRYADRSAKWNAYFESVSALIAESPPRFSDDLLFDRIAPLGLTPQGGFDARRFSAGQIAEIEAGIATARNMMRTGRRQGPIRDGWIYPKANLGDFGQDYFYRAQVAIGGLAALPRVEAMYMRPLGPDGNLAFDSGRDWVLRLPGDRLPPVDAFWSLTMYRMTPEGQFYFFDNPIARYAIGDRTAGLRRGPEGGIDIWMSRGDPGGARRANWLPTPPDGPFGVVLRAYLPRAELLEGQYFLPPVQAV